MDDDIWVLCPGQWENDSGPRDWYAVGTDDLGIIAYFMAEDDADQFCGDQRAKRDGRNS